MTMTKSVSKVLTTSTVVAAAATAINQAEALNDRPHHNRLRALQDEGEDASTASTSLSMPTNIESISNLMEDEAKFREKKEKLDIGILMSSVMNMKDGEIVDNVSQALDQMVDWDKKENLDELIYLAKHLLDGLDHSSTTSKSGKSKSGKGSKASGDDDGTCSFDGTTIGPFDPGTVSRYDAYGYCCEDSDCYGSKFCFECI